MSLTSDPELFAIFEAGRAETEIDTVIERSLRIKKAVVEQDEREAGLRRILNFGHTLGHGVEALEKKHHLYHGECVAIGMIPMCAPAVRARLLSVLQSLGLPFEIEGDLEEILEHASHDKKRAGNDISVVWVDEVGSFELRRLPIEDWKREIRTALGDGGVKA